MNGKQQKKIKQTFIVMKFFCMVENLYSNIISFMIPFLIEKNWGKAKKKEISLLHNGWRHKVFKYSSYHIQCIFCIYIDIDTDIDIPSIMLSIKYHLHDAQQTHKRNSNLLWKL